MRPVDADALEKSKRDWYCAPERCNSYNGVMCRACSIDDALNALDSAPTIAPESVIRCKDCRYWDEEFMRCSEHSIRDVNGDWEFQWFSASDDYCAWAMRRNDNAGQ